MYAKKEGLLSIAEREKVPLGKGYFRRQQSPTMKYIPVVRTVVVEGLRLSSESSNNFYVMLSED